MGNQLALRAQTSPGDQLICHLDAHIHRYEAGAPAALSGLQVSTIATENGSMPWSLVVEQLNPDDVHCAPARLLAFENTHNRCGGRVLDPEVLEETVLRARERGLRAHLDGARLWNAAIASGCSLDALAQRFDSVSVCFSKGMGAPVGSVLASTGEVITRARHLRKQWGGGMRQVGILAAACIYALDHHLERLVDDHARARRLARELRHPELRLSVEPETNIVLFDVEGPRTSGRLAAEWAERGLLVSTFGPRRVRLVTHLDLDDEACARALRIVAEHADRS
jgi:threonine aldolase